MPDLVGHHLIDGNARMDVCPCSLLYPHAREKRAAGPGVIPSAVGTRGGIHVIHPAEDLHLLLELGQRFQRAAKFEVLAIARRPPVGRRGR